MRKITKSIQDSKKSIPLCRYHGWVKGVVLGNKDLAKITKRPYNW